MDGGTAGSGAMAGLVPYKSLAILFETKPGTETEFPGIFVPNDFVPDWPLELFFILCIRCDAGKILPDPVFQNKFLWDR